MSKRIFTAVKSDKIRQLSPKVKIVNWDKYQTPNKAEHRTGRWQKLRKSILNSEPFCYFCHHFAKEVHHIDSKNKDKFYDLDNLVSICEECHKKVNDAYRRGITADILFKGGNNG